MENFKLSKTSVNPKGIDPFQRSGRVGRSPPAADRSTTSNEPVAVQPIKNPRVALVTNPTDGKKPVRTPPIEDNIAIQSDVSNSPRTETIPMVDMTKEELFHTPKTILESVETSITSGLEPNKSSPNQEFIYRMRSEEAGAIADVKKVLVKIKAALVRQKNISMDVREGVQEIEELICVAETCRLSWTKVELEKRRKLKAESVRKSSETPLASAAKRTAESPLEQLDELKKQRNENEKPEEWKTVSYRKRSNRETRQNAKEDEVVHRTPKKREMKKVPLRTKPEALIVKPTGGHSYADVLKSLRQDEGSESTVKVKTIRKTKTGSMLVELERGERINPEFLSKLKEAMKESGEVRSASPNTTLNVRDLDALTTAEEIALAIRDAIRIDEVELRIRLSKPNSRELVQAYITMPSREAEELLKIERIKVGWCRVRVRRHTTGKRCFRCFGVGHEQWSCTGIDRKGQGLCIRCGNTGHIMRTCTETPKCCLCVEAKLEPADHVPASGKCRAIRKQH